MLVTKKSSITGIEHTMEIPVTQEQLDAYYMGRSGCVQDAFPCLSADMCEFIMTGITPAEWNELSADYEDPETDSDDTDYGDPANIHLDIPF